MSWIKIKELKAMLDFFDKEEMATWGFKKSRKELFKKFKYEGRGIVGGENAIYYSLKM